MENWYQQSQSFIFFNFFFGVILGALSHFCLNPGSQLSHSFCSSSPGDFSMLFHFSQIDITGVRLH